MVPSPFQQMLDEVEIKDASPDDRAALRRILVAAGASVLHPLIQKLWADLDAGEAPESTLEAIGDMIEAQLEEFDEITGEESPAKEQ